MDSDLVIQLANSFKSKISEYFAKLAILRTQVPIELRLLLLPEYMGWDNFQSEICIDPAGNLGFEVFRESRTNLEIRIKSINYPIEKKIFEFYNRSKSMLNFKFAMNIMFENDEFIANNNTGIISVEFCDIRFIDCQIKSDSNDKPFHKKLFFVWIVERSIVSFLQPLSYADDDFYSALLTKIGKIIFEGHTFRNADTHLKILNYYMQLVEKIGHEISDSITVTESDELFFQQLLNKYRFFLYPSAKSIVGQYRLSGIDRLRIADFRIDIDDRNLMDIEIEPPFYKPFDGNQVSDRLADALNQIQEWKLISLHSNPLKKKISYLIIIGLDQNLNDEERLVLHRFNKSQSDLKVVTWDWVVENIRIVKEELNRSLNAFF